MVGGEWCVVCGCVEGQRGYVWVNKYDTNMIKMNDVLGLEAKGLGVRS